MFRINSLIAGLFLLPMIMIAGELNLADKGKTEYQIVIPDNADDTNCFAAKELRTFLEKITKANFKITRQSQSNSSKRIYVGLTKGMRELLPKVDFKIDHPARIIIKTKGDNLFLTGTQSSGTLLAVYSFLEDCLGCRWWTSEASFIPSEMKLRIPAVNLDYTPPFKDIRLAYYLDIKQNAIFATRLRNRTFCWYAKPEHKFLGGTLKGWPAYHTSFKLIPPKKYFSTHPEWFSLNKGKRTKNNQLCFSTDPDGLAREIFKNGKSYLDKNPEGFLMIGQMDKDGNSRCQCPKCLAIEKKEGSASGPIIYLVNKVADLVAKDYPKAKVMTFAYWYSEKAPKIEKVRDNVIIFLCAYNYPPFKSLSDSRFVDSLRNWSKIAKHIYIWNYVTSYGHYLRVFPNLNNIASNLRLFAKYNVDGVFVQGDSNCSVGDYVELRAYLLSHLLWNPNLNTEKLTKEFLDNYYGNAGKYLFDYLYIVNNSNLTSSSSSTIDMPLDIAKKGAILYKKALKTVAGNKKLTDRVIKARLSFVDNIIQNALGDKKYLEVLNVLGFMNISEAIDHLEKTAEKYSARCYSENGPPFSKLIEKYRKQNTGKVAEAPQIPGVNLKNKVHFDMQELSPRLTFSPPSKDVRDPKASNGKAIKMDGGVKGWHIHATLPKQTLEDKHIRKITVYVRAKVNFTGNNMSPGAKVFIIGVYDKKTKKNGQRIITRKDIKTNDSYSYYSFSCVISESAYVWVGSIGKKQDINDVLFDRIVIVKK